MEKKWALVTGASSGIGLAYAEELASLGYQLVIVSNEEQAIREKGEFLSEKYGIEVLPLYRDLAIPGAAKELYDACQEKNIPVDVLVNNAGMFFFCETLQAKANIVEKMLYLHVTNQGLLRINSPIEDIERSVAAYGTVQAANLEKGCSWITLFIAMAPSLGFLGTVIGMVMAFEQIQIAGDINPTIVAAGMKVALITTIFGIIVALILQLFYNYVLSKIDHLTAQMEESAITLLDTILKYKG